MNKKLVSFLILVAIFGPVIVEATTAKEMAEAVQKAVIEVGTVLVIVGWAVAGILYLTSVGNPGRMDIAKKALIAAVVGTILVILASGAKEFVQTLFGIKDGAAGGAGGGAAAD